VTNIELIERFYGAFAARDGAAMEACYAPDVHFSDPVFTDLRGREAGGMWRMLTGGATDLRIDLLERAADGDAAAPTGKRTTRSARPAARWSTTSARPSASATA
jgi:ketosteroid isomerase-like protein